MNDYTRSKGNHRPFISYLPVAVFGPVARTVRSNVNARRPRKWRLMVATGAVVGNSLRIA